MKPGDKIPIVLTVVRPLDFKEKVKASDGTEVEIINYRNDKFWASPGGDPNGSLILICGGGLETEAGTKRRRAIVDLIECGVAG